MVASIEEGQDSPEHSASHSPTRHSARFHRRRHLNSSIFRPYTLRHGVSIFGAPNIAAGRVLHFTDCRDPYAQSLACSLLVRLTSLAYVVGRDRHSDVDISLTCHYDVFGRQPNKSRRVVTIFLQKFLELDYCQVKVTLISAGWCCLLHTHASR